MISSKPLITLYKNEHNNVLRDFLFNDKYALDGDCEEFRDFQKDLLDYVLRDGKRSRPFLTRMGYRAIKGNDRRGILETKSSLPAVAVESLHAYFLVHDDIMDKSDLRRGKITFHKLYEEKARAWGFDNPEDFGVEIGIIGGDLLSARGYDIVLHSDFSDRVKINALKVYNRMNICTGNGQFLDSFYSRVPIEKISEENILQIHKNKTAIYSFEGPLHLGAVLGECTEVQLKNLTAYAIPLGIGFQIKDDNLGIFGKQGVLGKPIFSDLKEGKKTLLVLKAYEWSTNNQKKKILKALGNQNLTREEGTEIADIITDTGSKEYSINKKNNYRDECLEALTNANIDSESKEILIDYSDKMVNRDK
jgi:geranylgeranyl diphosphate synthase, type I